ncbi:MAG: hypothetical protein Q7S79_03575 [bacterium]|nr:hypothetical protein [bacterium]
MREKLCLENPELLDLIENKIILFQKNPEDTRLVNHPLKRKLKGEWAFSITGSIRIVYEWQGKSTVRFLRIGDHETVYKHTI